MAAVKQRKSGNAPASLDSFPLPSPPKTTLPQSRAAVSKFVDGRYNLSPGTDVLQTGTTLSVAESHQDGLKISLPKYTAPNVQDPPTRQFANALRDPTNLKTAKPKQYQPRHQQQRQQRAGLTSNLPTRKNHRLVLQRNHPVATRLLYPVNYVPRASFRRTHQKYFNGAAIGVIYEEHTSRTSFDKEDYSRRSTHSSISTQQHSDTEKEDVRDNKNAQGQRTDVMMDSEKQPPQYGGVQEPAKVYAPTSRYNTQSRDLEAQHRSGLPQDSDEHSESQYNPLDLPNHPPRHVSLGGLAPQSPTSMRNDPVATSTAGRPDQHPEGEDVNDESNASDEMTWGPSHPCFPHMNPHVPIDSPEYTSTRIIRVKRDWMIVGDLAPAFSNIYPEILDPLLQEQEFRHLIRHINTTLCRAFDPFSTWNWLDGLLGLVTGWLWEDFRPNGIKGRLRQLEAWIEEWNHKVGSRDGVKIIPLRRTGYMNLDIQIPDPQVRVVLGKDGKDAEEEETDLNPPPDGHHVTPEGETRELAAGARDEDVNDQTDGQWQSKENTTSTRDTSTPSSYNIPPSHSHNINGTSTPIQRSLEQ